MRHEVSLIREQGRAVPLIGLDMEGVAALCADLDLEPFHHREILAWIYLRRNLRPLTWTNIPVRGRELFDRRCVSGLPEIVEVRDSVDGTKKFLLELTDGLRIECVYIPDRTRRTVCISTQVGCAMGCAFCMTSKMGLKRNLSAGEMLGQLSVLERNTDISDIHYNVVFMGMGEPLANLDNLLSTLGALQDTKLGMGIARRRITVSTSGLIPELAKLASDTRCPRLAISINAASDELRSSLMPINKRYPLSRLRNVLLEITPNLKESLSLEYVLLSKVNDGVIDAEALRDFASGLKVKINLIEFNPARGIKFNISSMDRMRKFQSVLLSAGIATSIRRSRGTDISAACGQLAVNKDR